MQERDGKEAERQDIVSSLSLPRLSRMPFLLRLFLSFSCDPLCMKCDQTTGKCVADETKLATNTVCLIDGKCYLNGVDPDPQWGGCRWCRPASSHSEWRMQDGAKPPDDAYSPDPAVPVSNTSNRGSNDTWGKAERFNTGRSQLIPLSFFSCSHCLLTWPCFQHKCTATFKCKGLAPLLNQPLNTSCLPCEECMSEAEGCRMRVAPYCMVEEGFSRQCGCSIDGKWSSTKLQARVEIEDKIKC